MSNLLSRPNLRHGITLVSLRERGLMPGAEMMDFCRSNLD